MKINLGTKGIKILKAVCYAAAGAGVISSGILMRYAGQIDALDEVYRGMKKMDPDMKDVGIEIK